MHNLRHPLPFLKPTGRPLRLYVPPPARPAPCFGPVEVQLLRLGYRPGVPERLEEWAARVDAALCTDRDCPQCRGQGLRYKPFVRDRSYRAVAHCGRCGYQEEV